MWVFLFVVPVQIFSGLLKQHLVGKGQQQWDAHRQGCCHDCSSSPASTALKRSTTVANAKPQGWAVSDPPSSCAFIMASAFPLSLNACGCYFPLKFPLPRILVSLCRHSESLGTRPRSTPAQNHDPATKPRVFDETPNVRAGQLPNHLKHATSQNSTASAPGGNGPRHQGSTGAIPSVATRVSGSNCKSRHAPNELGSRTPAVGFKLDSRGLPVSGSSGRPSGPPCRAGSAGFFAPWFHVKRRGVVPQVSFVNPLVLLGTVAAPPDFELAHVPPDSHRKQRLHRVVVGREVVSSSVCTQT